MTSHGSGRHKRVIISAAIFLANKSDAYNNMRNAKVVHATLYTWVRLLLESLFCDIDFDIISSSM